LRDETGQWLRLDAAGFAITSERQNQSRFFAAHFAQFAVSEFHPHNGGVGVTFDNFTGDLLRRVNCFLANRRRLDVEPFGRLGSKVKRFKSDPSILETEAGSIFFAAFAFGDMRPTT